MESFTEWDVTYEILINDPNILHKDFALKISSQCLLIRTIHKIIRVRLDIRILVWKTFRQKVKAIVMTENGLFRSRQRTKAVLVRLWTISRTVSTEPAPTEFCNPSSRFASYMSAILMKAFDLCTPSATLLDPFWSWHIMWLIAGFLPLLLIFSDYYCTSLPAVYVHSAVYDAVV